MIVRIVAVGCAGLLAGIYFGDRAGPYYARTQLSDSVVVRSQQVVHVYYVRFMPSLVITALVAAVAWLLMVRSSWRSPEFWLVAASVCGIAVIAAFTRAVNVPLNNTLMTWNAAAPPAEFRKLWAPWERVNTMRAFVATAVLLLEATALSVRASSGGGL
jgi:uncharacterized membrane protein